MKRTLIEMIILLFFYSIGFSQIFQLKNEKIDYRSLVLKEKEFKSTNIDNYCDYLNMFIFAQDDEQQYLGKITTNEFDTESIINDFGNYGSKFSSTSIRNEFSTYGSEFSSYSAYNEFASYPPIIYKWNSSDESYEPMAFLTKNTFKTPAIDPDSLISVLESDNCGEVNPNYPDLQADSLWLSETEYYLGDSVTINFSISNKSDIDVIGTFISSLELDNSLIANITLNNIIKNSTNIGSKRIKITENLHFIFFIIDCDYQILENNELNNLSSIFIISNAKVTDLNIIQFSNKESLSIYPNPVTLNNVLQIDSEYRINTLTIYNSIGKEVIKKEYFDNIGSVYISSDTFKKGLYIIEIISNNKRYIKKLIIN